MHGREEAMVMVVVVMVMVKTAKLLKKDSAPWSK